MLLSSVLHLLKGEPVFIIPAFGQKIFAGAKKSTSGVAVTDAVATKFEFVLKRVQAAVVIDEVEEGTAGVADWDSEIEGSAEEIAEDVY